MIDGRSEIIHRSQIVSDTLPQLRNYINPGDMLEVRIRPPKNKESDFGLDFIRLLKHLLSDSEWAQNDSLFDLSIARRAGIVGGFVRSQRFKREVLSVFGHVCVICGISQNLSSEHSAAEAAHIVPRASRGTDNLHNGLCLCKIHHWAFDKGFISISETHTICVTPAVLHNPTQLGRNLLSFHDQPLSWPPSHPYPVEAFTWHRRNIFLNAKSLTEDT